MDRNWTRRKRRLPAVGLWQARFLRSIGRGRPLGHRRHSGVHWQAPCPRCHTPGRWSTHAAMAPSNDTRDIVSAKIAVAASSAGAHGCQLAEIVLAALRWAPVGTEPDGSQHTSLPCNADSKIWAERSAATLGRRLRRSPIPYVAKQLDSSTDGDTTAAQTLPTSSLDLASKAPAVQQAITMLRAKRADLKRIVCSWSQVSKSSEVSSLQRALREANRAHLATSGTVGGDAASSDTDCSSAAKLASCSANTSSRDDASPRLACHASRQHLPRASHGGACRGSERQTAMMSSTHGGRCISLP